MRFAKRFVLLCALSCFSLAAYAAPKIVTVHAQTVGEITAAMQSANSSGKPTIIKVKAGEYDLSAVSTFASEFGPSAFPPVTGTLYIEGKDAADTVFNVGGNLYRIFTVLPGGKLGVSDATLSNAVTFCVGDDVDDCDPFGGGAVANIEGVVWLEHCVLSENRAFPWNGAGAPTGGAVTSIRGHLHILDTIISGNRISAGGGAGLRLVGGMTTIERSIFRENVVLPGPGNGGDLHGGAIYISGGNLSIANSTIVGNQSSQPDPDDWAGHGSGLYNGGAIVKIVDSAVINNAGGGSGAGGGIYNGGQMTLRNVTVAGNSVGTRGGGVYNGGTLKMRGVTIANNVTYGRVSPEPTRVYPHECFQYENQPCPTGGGGLWNAEGATIRMSNTLVANNIIDVGPYSLPTDCYGTILSEGLNAVKNLADCTLQGSHNDLTSLKVRVGNLEDNGKPGNAHLPLLSNSPLIDAGGKVFEQCSARDQIGNRRADGNQDGKTRCDIGAIEFAPPGTEP